MMIRADSTNHDSRDHHPSAAADSFQHRVLAMLEGAAFALLHDQIRGLEQVARSNAISQLESKVEQIKLESEALARREKDMQAAIAKSDDLVKSAEEQSKRLRKRSRRAARAAELYRKAVEDIRERLDELVNACDGMGIASDLEAIIELIEKASRMDPDFQSG